MRILIAAAVVSASALAAVGVLGVAGAETTTSPAPVASVPPRTVSVQGVASAPVTAEASAATATGVYRQALAGAVADGQAKAQFLAEKAAATLGAVQSIGEGGGSIECPEDEEYQGGQPDFGFAGVGETYAPLRVSAVAGRPVPATRKPAAKHHQKKRVAKSAALGACTLSTQVTLVYLLS